MPIAVKLQRDAAIYSICVDQNLVDNVTADCTDKCACTSLNTVPCSTEHSWSSTRRHLALLKRLNRSGTNCDGILCHAVLYTNPKLPMSWKFPDYKEAHMA